MRMPWLIFPVMAVVFLDKIPRVSAENENEMKLNKKRKCYLVTSLVGLLMAVGLSYQFMLLDNIVYFNLNERYEKTYAYCLRMVDRIEQADGYEPGMPIAMIGSVDKSKYPTTCITNEVTDYISGGGDLFVVLPWHYIEFMKHYLNFTVELVSDEQMVEIYNSSEYKELESFPSANSVKVVNGVVYIKTEPTVW